MIATLDEKSRRWFAGFWASQLGHGGVEYVATVTGLSRPTITRGRQEITQGAPEANGRVRTAGGGRKSVEKNPRLSSKRLKKGWRMRRRAERFRDSSGRINRCVKSPALWGKLVTILLRRPWRVC